ncbi:hypothetical protein HYE67_001533 [Fusarium culmorum]|uniref:Uncharacterized protein n=1 Tax=Fusarium culmorum TaxID=5516 RepID=A0A7S8CZT2_FUSCU|nr:hypothetical protein HYE67_001533 [Fusarium culmorum]
MSFLQGKTIPQGQDTDYLCESQVSVLVTAINSKIWTGYCFVDTYHEPVEKRQTVENYCKNELDPDQVQKDPCVDHDSETPILDPGEYFLTSLDCQLRFFKNEWMETNRMFTERVKEYVRAFHTLQRLALTDIPYAQIDHFPYEAQNIPGRSRQARQEPLKWLRQTRRILTDLISCLDLTISCWDNYPFQGQFQTEYAQRCLTSIQQSFVESKNCLKKLEGIRTLCDEHKENGANAFVQLSLYGIDAQNHISQLQTKAAENAQTISYFLLYVLSPATIAATMLSMQEKAIPTILGPTKVSFFILTPVLTLAVYALSWTIRSWERIQRFFNHMKPQGVYQPETIELEEIV